MSDPTNPYQPAPPAPGDMGAYGAGMPPAQYQYGVAAPVAPVGPPPQPVVNAARLMFLSAALSVIGLIVLFSSKDSLRAAIEKKNPGFDAQKVDTAVNAAVGVGVVFGIIFIVLYVLLALQVQKGKNWARIVAWVITGLGVLSALASLAQPSAGASRLFSLIGGVIDLAIIVLLAQKVSNDYFRRRPVQ
jgi:hypothetical protein